MTLTKFIESCNATQLRESGKKLSPVQVKQAKKFYIIKLFEQRCLQVSRMKRSRGYSSRLTEQDIQLIKNECRKALRESQQSSNQLQFLRECNKVNIQKNGRRLTEKEINYLKLKYNARKLRENSSPREYNSLSGAIKNYKRLVAMKERVNPNTVKVTYKELKFLKEQVDTANKRGVRLTEADMGMDPAAGAGAPMPGDPNAAGMPGAMPGAPVDPTIVAQVQDAKNSIDALASAVGIQSTDVNADPNAGIPAVDGMQQPGADPNAGAPMMESKRRDRLSSIRERIEARKKLIEGNGAQEGAKKDLQRIGIAGGVISSGQENKGAESGAEQVVVPAAGTLANGYTSGAASGETKAAKTWPTKATKSSETGGALQGSGASQKKIKEECEDEEDKGKKKKEDKLEESATSVTDKYVEKALAPKLDFSRLSEALRNGILG